MGDDALTEVGMRPEPAEVAGQGYFLVWIGLTSVLDKLALIDPVRFGKLHFNG